MNKNQIIGRNASSWRKRTPQHENGSTPVEHHDYIQTPVGWDLGTIS